ncbi:MAG: PglZ domain-containing protein [Ignavibacteriae bacterium HGW-Ignavibacteriae-1]|jgi:CheY-like chemotaxis protein|nr:MAG: PglZ domain-containing protein [Ignavibacteriae bacterium HGW-Ignavibacteriae-1]
MDKIKGKILWIDDEIDLLRPHIILLNQRGFDVATATNGEDAIEMLKQEHFDLIFLDESMVGISGLETLPILKEIDSTTPIVMVTKNEAESVMEEAIGSKIDDYLTKPVNPTQILMAAKKFIESSRIEEEKFTQNYLMGFNEISRQMLGQVDWKDWVEIYTRLVQWSMELDRMPNTTLTQTLQDQFRNANAEFSKFIERNYINWLDAKYEDADPVLSPHLLDTYLKPLLSQSKTVFIFVVDCLRLDQWLVMQELLASYYSFKTNYYCTILPTATQYARNSIFSGLYPIEIKKHYPQWWNSETNSEDHKLNAFEKELLEAWIERRRIKLRNRPGYVKIFDTEFGQKIERDIMQYTQNHLNAFVLNAVDMIAHSRSDYAILKEIAPDESAYRSLTRSWFRHSSFFGMLKALSKQKDISILITTDHGSVRCMRGVKVLGDRDTSTNLRYKFGKNVKAESRYAMQIARPEDYKLPAHGITVNNIIAKEDYYFVYPTDYHHYLNKYRDSFQHGGISMEEMICPVVQLTPR